MTTPWRVALLTLLLLLAPALACAAQGAAPRIERFALVIGNNRPEQSAGSASVLRYADDDAVASHRLLLDSGAHSVLLARLDEDSLRQWGEPDVDGTPTVAALERAFSELAALMREAAARGASAELLLFFSGHGDVADGEGFIVLEDQRLTRSRLFDLLSRSPAVRNHVFIDACKSYFLVFDRGPGGRREAFSSSTIAERVPARLDDTGFVLSTSSDRDSHEWERYQGGVLSHELRSALRGAADANLDARISYAELGAFLAKANQSIQNPRFRPDFMVRAPRQQLEHAVLTWAERPAAIQVGHAYLGPFYVETAEGNRLLDAHPAPGQRLQLWAPSQRPLFVRRKDGLGEAVVSTRAPQSITELAVSTPEVASRGALSLALENLFASPFREADVQEFERADRLRARPAPGTERSERRDTLRWTTGVLALSTAAAGVTLNAIAGATYLQASGEPQRRIPELNQRIDTLNRLSLACYTGAVVAGALWAWATWWPEAPVTVAPAAGDAAGVQSFGFEAQARF